MLGIKSRIMIWWVKLRKHTFKELIMNNISELIDKDGDFQDEVINLVDKYNKKYGVNIMVKKK